MIFLSARGMFLGGSQGSEGGRGGGVNMKGSDKAESKMCYILLQLFRLVVLDRGYSYSHEPND